MLKHIKLFKEFIINESQRLINLIYSKEIGNLKPLTLKDYRKEYKGGGGFETSIKLFGSNTKDLFIWVAKTQQEMDIIKNASQKYGVINVWTVDENKYNICIMRD